MLARTIVAIAAGAALLGCASQPSGAREGGAAHARAACTRVRIGGHEQCLTAGRPCNPRYERQYEHRGFQCRRNNAGHYRLWQPLKPGQPRV